MDEVPGEAVVIVDDEDHGAAIASRKRSGYPLRTRSDFTTVVNMPPHTITASEANRSFSRLLRRVRNGETVEITSHGEAVAELRPIVNDVEAQRREKLKRWEAHCTELESQEFVVVGPWTRAELYERG